MAGKKGYAAPSMSKGGGKSGGLAKGVGKPHKDSFVNTPATMLKKGK